jgi:hypothetical protein
MDSLALTASGLTRVKVKGTLKCVVVEGKGMSGVVLAH